MTNSASNSDNLTALLKPRNIALIGASERAPHAAALMRNLFRFGFPKDRIYPVNPRYEQLFDLPCYPSVGAVPGDVDLAVVAIPRDGTVQVMEECAAKGVRAALTVATGFGEFDETGRGYQAELARIVRESGMALAGPNTLGYLALESGAALWSSPLPELLTIGPVSAVFSSAGLLNLFLNTAADRCLGFRYAIAPGNQVGAGFTDYLRAAVDDDGTRVIVAVIESMSRPEEMAGLLDLARERGKVVVALRLGRSQKGGRAVASHSGNMATSGAVWDGLFRQKGVIPVDNLDQMLEVTALAVGTPEPYRLPAAGGVGIVTISGGDCSFLADICERNDVDLPEPAGATYEALRRYFDKESFNGNPLDIEELHWAEPARVSRMSGNLHGRRQLRGGLLPPEPAQEPQRPPDAVVPGVGGGAPARRQAVPVPLPGQRAARPCLVRVLCRAERAPAAGVREVAVRGARRPGAVAAKHGRLPGRGRTMPVADSAETAALRRARRRRRRIPRQWCGGCFATYGIPMAPERLAGSP